MRAMGVIIRIRLINLTGPSPPSLLTRVYRGILCGDSTVSNVLRLTSP